MWTIQNIVRVALMQVGVVITSILVGGIYHKWSSLSQPPLAIPPSQVWWYEHGGFGFALPLIWVVCALYLHRQETGSDVLKFLTFWLGVFAVVILAFQAISAIFDIFRPDLRM